ncbi:MAG: DNA polymerase III subunit chi [Sterolibacteriaceae bacterium]|nr:DNA polymerase III subunit chi [Sterolibacteriaceae bacterium]
MTNVAFFHGANDRLQAAADWLVQTAHESRSVVVYIPSGADCQRLDRLLWTVPATGFVAHCMADDRLAGETPIVLASALENPAHDDCLLNLSDEIPPGFSRFQQLVEIVSVDDRDRLPGRERFRFYRERGYPLSNDDISKGFESNG